MAAARERDAWGWVWAPAVVLLGLGGYISTSPLVGQPVHLYAAVALAVGTVGALLARGIPRGFGWVIALWLAYGLAVIATPGRGDYAATKWVTLFTATLIAAVAPLVLLHTPERVRRLLVALFVFAMGVSVLAWLNPDVPHRLSLVGSNYIGSGRIINLAFALALLALVLRAKPRLLLVPVVLATGYLSLLTGSRGPLLAAVTAAVIVALFRRGSQHGKATVILSLLPLGAAGVWFLNESTGFAQSRILGLSAADSSVSTRWQYYAEAAQMGVSNPFGVGWGNFYWAMDYAPAVTAQAEVFPHNLFLEVWAEGGWLALLATAAFVVVAMRNLWRASASPVWAAALGVAVYFLVNAMVSTDIDGNRILFSILILGVSARMRRQLAAARARPRSSLWSS